MELLCALSLAQLCWDSSSLDDLNAGEPNSVTRGHLSVHLLHSPIECRVPVLLVHVVVTGTALVPEPYTIVINLGWILLKNLCDWTREKEPYSIYSDVL